MDESSFHERADALLSALMEAIEIADEEGSVEVDLIEAVLTIHLENGAEYVINKHEPSTQIWLSSPESGASHFGYDDQEDEWISTEGEPFKEKVSDELGRLAGLDVEF